MQEKERKRAIRVIERIGEEFYQKKVLTETFQKIGIKKEDELFENRLSALKFFLFYAFMHGRNDELSNRYIECVLDALMKIPSLFFDRIGNIEIIRDGKKIKKWEVEKETFLAAYVTNVEGSKIKVNPNDLISLKSAAALVNSLSDYDKNIMSFVRDKQLEGKISEAYYKLTQYPMIKDKIAAFFLRDCATIFRINAMFLEEKEIFFLLPIDTWAKQVCTKLWGPLSINKIKSKIIGETNDPIAFNQGAWYVGKHSFKLLMDNIAVFDSVLEGKEKRKGLFNLLRNLFKGPVDQW